MALPCPHNNFNWIHNLLEFDTLFLKGGGGGGCLHQYCNTNSRLWYLYLWREHHLSDNCFFVCFLKCPAGSGDYRRVFPQRKPSLDQEDKKPLHMKTKQWGMGCRRLMSSGFHSLPSLQLDNEEKPQSSQLTLSHAEDNKETAASNSGNSETQKVIERTVDHQILAGI